MNDISVLIFSDYQPEIKLVNKIEKLGTQSKEIFGFLQSEIANADIAAVNIEYPITDNEKPILKSGPVLKCSPDSIIPLKSAGFNLATLGNNHSFNFGNKGVLDSIMHSRNAGLNTIGVGINLSEARKILYKDVRGKKIAFLNFAEIEFNAAKINKGGANPLDLIYNLEDIKEAKNNADYVILIIHGGSDFVYYPNPAFVKKYRFYAEQGVSAIVAHHTHFISAYEVHDEVPIFYSLGNFIHAVKGFEYGYYIGMGIKLILNDEIVNFEIIPYFFDVDEVCIKRLNDNQKTYFYNKIVQLNKSLENLQSLENKWGQELMHREKSRILTLLTGLPNNVFKIFRKLHLLWLLNWVLTLNKGRFLPIWNILRCEHHQDIINATFEKSFINEN